MSKQFAISKIFDALVKLLAPILAYTCDEAWEHAGHSDSVHEQDFPEADPAYDTGLTPVFTRLQQIRSVIQVAIEAQIKAKVFNKNNEAVVQITVPAQEDEAVLALLRNTDFAKEFFIVSDVQVQVGDQLVAVAAKSPHNMCPRCRRYEPAADAEGLCERCAVVMHD